VLALTMQRHSRIADELDAKKDVKILTNAAESDINHKSTIAEAPGELLQKVHFSGKRMPITYDADAQVMISEFLRYFSAWRNAKLLIGTSMCWFFVDVAYVCLLEPFYCHLFYLHSFYGINLNQNVVLEQIGFAGKKGTPWERMFKVGIGNLIITALGFVPGMQRFHLSLV
jgi:hypothetical protein